MGLDPLLAVFSLGTAWSGRDPSARVRLGSAAGSGWHFFKASPSFLALPASRADCLPPPEEGSLLSGLISCQLSVFFLCFCCSLRQTGWGGDRERPSRAGPSQGWGPLPLPCSLRGNTIAQTSLLLWSGLVLSPNCPSLFPGQALQPPRPFCLACLYLQKHPMSGPGSLKARLNSKLPGDDIPAPSQSWPLLLAPPPNTSMGPLFSLQGMTAPLSISQVPALTQPPP